MKINLYSGSIVSFKILIDGTDKTSVFDVKSIVVNHEINRIPYASLILLDGDSATGNFKLSASEDFVPGKTVQIKAGYDNIEETIFEGIIIKHGIKIRESVSVLTVECKHEAIKLTVGRKSAYYYDSKDSDIADQLLANKGISSNLEATSDTHAELVQYQITDWDFIVTRAQVNGQLCFLEKNEVKIAKPDFSGADTLELKYGTSIFEFDGEIDSRYALKKITAASWDGVNQERLENESSPANKPELGDLTSATLAETLALENYLLEHGGKLTETELQDWSAAKSLLQELALNRGRVKFAGNAAVKPGIILNLDGLGPRFTGDAYVTAVSHEITAGNWFTNAQYGLDAKWFTETFNINSQPASGITAAVNGLQIGVVTQLRDDPEGEDRILVKLPIVNNEEEGIWARIALLDAGDTRGSCFRPEIGDEVILGFINDDPNDAIILGSLNSSSKPAPITASDDNHEKGFITRSGNQLLFNDELNTILVKTPGERLITINDDSEEITIDDAGNGKIILNSDGITITSSADINIEATGDLNLSGTNVSIKAQSEFKAEGASGAELSTSAIAVLKGSLVQIN